MAFMISSWGDTVGLVMCLCWKEEDKITKEEVMLALTFLVNLLSYFMSVAIILPRGEAREERGKVDRYWRLTSRLAIGTCRQPNLLPM
mgnify:CR=1 FL=1